jgi:hypothetical protein
VNVETFIKALRMINLDVLSDEIEAAANGLTAPGFHMSIGSISAGNSVTISPLSIPLQASSARVYAPEPVRKRTISAIDKIGDEGCMIFKVPHCEEDQPLASMPMERVMVTTHYAKAKEIANEMMDEDVEELNGKEEKIKHDYVIFQFKSAVVATKKIVKDRVKEKRPAAEGHK